MWRGEGNHDIRKPDLCNRLWNIRKSETICAPFFQTLVREGEEFGGRKQGTMRKGGRGIRTEGSLLVSSLHAGTDFKGDYFPLRSTRYLLFLFLHAE